jgi:hypothetical protein
MHPLVERASRLATARRVIALGALVLTALVLLKLAAHHFDASYFVMTGLPTCTPGETPASLTCPTQINRGYDGQFFYRLALDPFTSKVTDFGITFDRPSYRHQRILLPLAAWVLSGGGRPGLALLALLAVNLVAGIALTATATKLATSLGARPLWALGLSLYPGFLISIARDLSEIAACSLLLGGMFLARRARWWSASLIFLLAALTRETTLVVPAALLLVQFVFFLRGPRPKLSTMMACAWPLAAFLGWQLLLMRVWGVAPALANRGTLLPPFVGLARFAVDAARHAYVLDVIQISLLVATIVVTGRALLRAEVPPWEKIAWCLYAVLATLLSDQDHWNDQASYLRVTTELFVVSWPILLASEGTFPRVLLGGWGALSVLHFVIAIDLLKL